MTQTVTLPNGEVHEFPDEATPDQIAKALNVKPPAAIDTSIGSRMIEGAKDAVLGARQRLYHTVGDSVVEAGNKVTQAINDIPGIGPALREIGFKPTTTKDLDQYIADREANYADARARAGQEDIDWARAGGNALATLPLALAGGASLPGVIGTGVASGLIQPVAKGDYGTESAINAGLGAAGGLVGQGVAKTVSGAIAPKVSDAVRKLYDEGIRPTVGQIKGGAINRIEQALMSVPGVGDVIGSARKSAIGEFNQAAANRALAPIGETVESAPGREMIQEVSKKIGDVYDKIRPNLQIVPDQALSNDIGAAITAGSELPADLQPAFKSFLQERVFKPLAKGNTNFKDIESELSREASSLGASSSHFERKMGSIYNDINAALRQNLERVNPDIAGQLKAANEAWANFVRLRGAGSMQGAPEGVFSPSQLSAAVKSADKSVGKGSFAKGEAMMQDLSDAGKSVLGDKYPDRGTAGRLMAAALMNGGAGGTSFLAGGPAGIAAQLAAQAAVATPYAARKSVAWALARPTGQIEQNIAGAVENAAPALRQALISALSGPQKPFPSTSH